MLKYTYHEEKARDKLIDPSATYQRQGAKAWMMDEIYEIITPSVDGVFFLEKQKGEKNMRYIEVWFLDAFGNNELHVDQIVYEGDSNLAKKELANRFIGYTYELHNLEGGYYICFFHKSEKNKPIKSNNEKRSWSITWY